MNSTPNILNPLTPKALLPPDIAAQIQIADYMFVGALAAFIWDVLCNASTDYRLFKGFKLSLGSAAYILARIVSFSYLFVSTMFQTYPIGFCARFFLAANIFYALSVTFNASLILLRGIAVFRRDPLFIGLFIFLWLGVIAGAVTVPIADKGANLGPLKYCVNTSSKPYMGAAGVTPVAHDTIIFLVISWRLFQNSHTDTVAGESHLNMKGAVSFFTGSKLPRFSRALLHDGQVYYLVTVACNLLTLIMFYNSDIQVTYRVMFTGGNVMLSNVMASRVWRHTKFGFKARGGTEFSSGTHSAVIAAPGPGRNPRAALSSGRPEHGIEIFHMKSTVLDIDEASVDNCKNETTFTHAGDAVDLAV